MSKKKCEKEKTEKDIIRDQFLAFTDLRRKIRIINDVNDYHELQHCIGDKAERVRFQSYMETFDKMMYDMKYTILLEDDAMLFLYYEFDEDGNVISHVLSYLPDFRHDIESEKRDDDEEYEINYIQLHKRISNFVRIDFENEGREEYFHSLIHMHIGTEKNALRIPIEHSVLPFEFIFLIFKYIYRLKDVELIELECNMARKNMLTEKEKQKLRLAFCNQIIDEKSETA